MTQQVNTQGADWLNAKTEINDRIAKLQEQMLNILSIEEYHQCRGAILFGRELIEWAEPTTPPKTIEDNYGISDPDSENYA